MTRIEILLVRIEKYCRREKIGESTFGLRAVNDGKLVRQIREGRSITIRTLERIEELLDGSAERAA